MRAVSGAVVGWTHLRGSRGEPAIRNLSLARQEQYVLLIEANPGTVDEAYLTAIRKLGVNRLSLGVQSLNDGELAMLGRIHTAAEARDAVRFARGAGFDNLSLDLIYGLPGQTLADWQAFAG